MKIETSRFTELIEALELALLTAPNVPAANMSNGCIKMVIEELNKLRSSATNDQRE